MTSKTKIPKIPKISLMTRKTTMTILLDFLSQNALKAESEAAKKKIKNQKIHIVITPNRNLIKDLLKEIYVNII